MDAALTPALVATLTLLGKKAAETVASDAAKDAYAWVKARLAPGEGTDPLDEAETARKALEDRPELGREIAEHLGRSEDPTVREVGERLLAKLGPPAPLVGKIENAQGVNVAGRIDKVTQTFHGKT